MILAKTSIYLFLIGALIAVLGNFGMLLYKLKNSRQDNRSIVV